MIMLLAVVVRLFSHGGKRSHLKAARSLAFCIRQKFKRRLIPMIPQEKLSRTWLDHVRDVRRSGQNNTFSDTAGREFARRESDDYPLCSRPLVHRLRTQGNRYRLQRGRCLHVRFAFPAVSVTVQNRRAMVSSRPRQAR